MSTVPERPLSVADAPITPIPEAAGRPGDARSARREQLAQLGRSKTFLAGVVLVGIWVACALLGGRLAPQDPLAANPLDDLLAPSAEHWFGTDRVGRDVFSRVLVGARDILVVAPLATLLGTVVGTVLGLVMGYFRGIVDDVVSRVVDAFLALPTVLVALLALVSLGPSRGTVIVTIGLVFAPVVARTVRAAVLSERDLDYVAAARLRDEGTFYVLFAEILPNVMGPVLVEFTVRLGYAIFTIATLSFLGFGIQPPAPDWGVQIFEHYALISAGFWWTVLFPALAIATLVIGFNLIADGVTAALEER